MESITTAPSPHTSSSCELSFATTAVTQSPTYPSPVRSDSGSLSCPAEGLGIYGFSGTIAPVPCRQRIAVFPPSPELSEHWGKPSATSAIGSPMTDDHEQAWSSAQQSTASGATFSWNPAFFATLPNSHDHAASPLSSGPLLYSAGTSIASSYDSSVYSYGNIEGPVSAHGRLESQPQWYHHETTATGNIFEEPNLALSPENLNSASAYPFNGHFIPNGLPEPESVHAQEGEPDPNPTIRRRTVRYVATSTRQQRGRIQSTPENASHRCDDCGALFRRAYNLRQHLQTERHNPDAQRSEVCEWEGCDKKFRRKADLQRHQSAVSTSTRSLNLVLTET